MKPSRPSLLSEFYQKDFNDQENGDLNNDSDSSDDEDIVCESSETGFNFFFILFTIIYSIVKSKKFKTTQKHQIQIVKTTRTKRLFVMKPMLYQMKME